MNFRTKISPVLNPIQITYDDAIFTVGSCFAKHIGAKLKSQKFQVSNNAFGTIYNPISICKLLQYAVNRHQITSKELIQNEDIFSHWDFHSDFSSTDPDEVVQKTNQVLHDISAQIDTLQYIFVSFGSAYAYKYEGKIVSNCHKIPSSHFEKIRLDTDLIKAEFITLKKSLEAINKNIQWVFTVSPVRHIRDGIIENQRSKSILIETCHQINDQFENCHYFPSYEIMMDDLRDYRFYTSDLLHPSEQAIDYIWDFFISSYMNDSTISKMDRITKLIRNVHHRPFHQQSNAHQQFVKKTMASIKEMTKEMSNVDFSEEITQLAKQIIQ